MNSLKPKCYQSWSRRIFNTQGKSEHKQWIACYPRRTPKLQHPGCGLKHNYILRKKFSIQWRKCIIHPMSGADQTNWPSQDLVAVFFLGCINYAWYVSTNFLWAQAVMGNSLVEGHQASLVSQENSTKYNNVFCCFQNLFTTNAERSTLPERRIQMLRNIKVAKKVQVS